MYLKIVKAIWSTGVDVSSNSFRTKK